MLYYWVLTGFCLFVYFDIPIAIQTLSNFSCQMWSILKCLFNFAWSIASVFHRQTLGLPTRVVYGPRHRIRSLSLYNFLKNHIFLICQVLWITFVPLQNRLMYLIKLKMLKGRRKVFRFNFLFIQQTLSAYYVKRSRIQYEYNLILSSRSLRPK